MVKEAVLRILNTRLHLCAEVRTLPLRMDFFAQQGNGHHQTVTSIHSRPPCAAQASRHFVDIAGHWVKVTIASTGSRAVFKIVCCVKQSHRCLPPPLQLQVGRIPADPLPAPGPGAPMRRRSSHGARPSPARAGRLSISKLLVCVPAVQTDKWTQCPPPIDVPTVRKQWAHYNVLLLDHVFPPPPPCPPRPPLATCPIVRDVIK